MNRYKLRISLVGLTFGCLGTINCTTEPVSAQEIEIDNIKVNIESFSNSFSTNAMDLLADDRLAQGTRDLEKFCTNYPYNSQCRDRQPSIDPTEAKPKPTTKESSRPQSTAPKSGWAIVPEVSTLGLGGSVVKKIIPQLNARIGVNGFGVNFDIEDTDLTYEGDLSLLNVSSIIDFHPIKKSGFRFSAGLVFNNNEVQGTANISDEGVVELGGEDFDVANLASVDADVEITNSFAPYLGIGWGNAVGQNKGLGFWLNAGIMLGGSPDITVTPNIVEGVPADIRQDIEEAAEEEEQEIEDDLNFINVYPVVSLGLSYQF